MDSYSRLAFDRRRRDSLAASVDEALSSSSQYREWSIDCKSEEMEMDMEEKEEEYMQILRNKRKYNGE